MAVPMGLHWADQMARMKDFQLGDKKADLMAGHLAYLKVTMMDVRSVGGMGK